MMTMTVSPCVYFLAPALLLSATICIYNDGQPVPFEITTKRPTDSVQVRQEKDVTILDIHSPFGISSATITRLGESWPKKVVLRLHLKGLENFRTGNGQATLPAAASVENGKPG